MPDYRKMHIVELRKLRDTFPPKSPEHQMAAAEIKRRSLIVAAFFLGIGLLLPTFWNWLMETSK
jgi:hypothetical protein